jgi:hypothetical protein
MKSSKYLRCFLVILLSLPPIPCLAAPQDSGDCAELEKTIAEMKELEKRAKSETTKRVFKESKLKLYEQLGRCIEGEIALATEMQRTVALTAASADVDEHLRVIVKQRAEAEAEVIQLRLALNVAGTGSTAGPATTPAAVAMTSSASNAGNGNGSSAPGLAPASVTPASVNPAPVAAPQGTSCDASASYETAPNILKDMVQRLATQVVNSGDPEFAGQAGIQVVLYTVFDAASARSSELVQALDAYQYIGETTRTDKQLGASPDSEGSVSAIEKPGFAQFLGFAIEHGGITKENDGTNLTLSTSLYSLYALATKDTAENYARAGILNRVGVAATFNVENQDDELANARRNNLSQWSARVRLFGDRSSRASAFQKVYLTKVRPLILERLRSVGRAMEGLEQNNEKYGELEKAALDTLPNEVRARMACPDYTAATAEQKERMITEVILGRLRTTVYQPVNSGSFDLGKREIFRIEQEYLPDLKSALHNLLMANDILKNAFEDVQKGPLATFAYTNHRVPTASDYSETKFLFEQEKGFMGPLKLIGNIGGSFYHRPNRSMNQQRARDFSAALAFEGTSRSPFTEADDMSKITYSFVGRYQRLFENRKVPDRTPDIGSLQFVTDVPLFRGFSFPFSITYSNATEDEKKQGFRFNFGMRMDTDKLIDLLRAGSNR